jgi:hypothetical protein
MTSKKKYEEPFVEGKLNDLTIDYFVLSELYATNKTIHQKIGFIPAGNRKRRRNF